MTSRTSKSEPSPFDGGVPAMNRKVSDELVEQIHSEFGSLSSEQHKQRARELGISLYTYQRYGRRGIQARRRSVALEKKGHLLGDSMISYRFSEDAVQPWVARIQIHLRMGNAELAHKMVTMAIDDLITGDSVELFDDGTPIVWVAEKIFGNDLDPRTANMLESAGILYVGQLRERIDLVSTIPHAGIKTVKWCHDLLGEIEKRNQEIADWQVSTVTENLM